MSPELLWKLGRLGNISVQNGDLVAFTVRRYELSENGGSSTLFLRSLSDDSQTSILEKWKSIGDLQWAPYGNGHAIYFTGMPPKIEDGGEEENADDANAKFATSPQVYRYVVDGEPVRISSVEDGVSNLKVSPTGKQVVFTIDVKLDAEVTDIY